jgi:hypothetical protein
MSKKKKPSKVIAFQDNMVSDEPLLPYPRVYYPGHYGAFLGFSKENSSDIFFCSCSKLAIENYILFRIKFEKRMNIDPERNFILSKAVFPQLIVKRLIEQNEKADKKILDKLKFKDGICHECNKQTPVYSYCHPMYGGIFEQNYGWYINKQSFEYGVMPVSFKLLENTCPDEVFSSLDYGKKEFLEKYNSFSETELIIAQAQDSDFQKATRKIRNIIENEVRVKFGFKKVGEAWASETLLYQLINEIFPDRKIIRHYRPEILEFFELDVFIPSLNLGIEYQGIQHFKSINHWGGKESLEQTKKRDKRKKKLCEINKIKLIYFYYYEELSRELVENKIKSLI